VHLNHDLLGTSQLSCDKSQQQDADFPLIIEISLWGHGKKDNVPGD
jgi:hypothetical protein